MFRGSSVHTLDPKGRIIIPTRFRHEVWASRSETLMFTRMDGGLFVYTLDQWIIVENAVFSLKETSESMRRFRRVFIGGAEECQMDRQGRILIPAIMREYAGLEKDVALVGQNSHFEIWSLERYQQEIDQFNKDLKNETFANEIAQLGL